MTWPDTESIPPHGRSCATVRRSSLPYSPVIPSVSCWGGEGGDASTTCCLPHQEQWKSQLFLELWSSADGSNLNSNWLLFEKKSHQAFKSLFLSFWILIYPFLGEMRDNLNQVSLTWVRKPKWILNCVSVLPMLRYAMYRSKFHVMKESS